MYQMGPKSPSVNGATPGGKPPAVSDAQAREKLAVYVYEYLIHVGAKTAAQTFLSEIRWEKSISIGDPPGFLHSWWCVFWDLYCAAPERRETNEHSNEAKAFHDYSTNQLATNSQGQQQQQQPGPSGAPLGEQGQTPHQYNQYFQAPPGPMVPGLAPFGQHCRPRIPLQPPGAPPLFTHNAIDQYRLMRPGGPPPPPPPQQPNPAPMNPEGQPPPPGASGVTCSSPLPLPPPTAGGENPPTQSSEPTNESQESRQSGGGGGGEQFNVIQARLCTEFQESMQEEAKRFSEHPEEGSTGNDPNKSRDFY